MNEYKESTGIIIQDEQKRVMFLKRSTNGLWTFPGGKVDPGETSLECAYRELREETGITGIQLNLFSCTTSFAHGQYWKEYMYIGNIDKTVKYENIEKHKFEKIVFFDIDEIPPIEEIEVYVHILIKQLKGEVERKLEHDF